MRGRGRKYINRALVGDIIYRWIKNGKESSLVLCLYMGDNDLRFVTATSLIVRLLAATRRRIFVLTRGTT